MVRAACAIILALAAAAGGQQKRAAAPYTWRNAAIVAGGFVTGVQFHPTERNLIYARTDMGGAYRWESSARRWVPLTDWVGPDDWTLLGIESLALDPTDPNRVYMAAGTYTNDWSGNGAILRSSDRGRTWKRTNMPLKFGGNEDGRSIGERLAVDPNMPSRLLLGTRHDGLWSSADRGATWKKVAGFPALGRSVVGGGIILFDASSARRGHPTPVVYAGTDAPGSALLRSRDSGATWETVPGQPSGLIPHHAELDRQGTLYVTYSDRPGPNGVSGGAVWKLNTKTGQWTDITPEKPGPASRFGYAGLALDARRPGTLVVTTICRWGPIDEAFRSTDGGATWRGIAGRSVRDVSLSPFLKWAGATSKFGWWIGSFAIDPFDSGHAMYVTGATIYGTNDLTSADRDAPTHWYVHARGVEQTAVQDMVSPPTGPHLLSGVGDLGGFRHDDFTKSPAQGMFSNPVFGSVSSLDFAEQRPSLVARVGSAGNGLRSGAWSSDGGATWRPFGSEPEGSRGGGTVAVSADGRSMVWSANGAAPSVSLDSGTTWTACAGLPRQVDVHSDRVDPRRFYALDSGAGRLYVSTDAGATFGVATGSLPAGKLKLRTAPGRTGDLWVSAETGGLFRSTDAGATFRRLPGAQACDAMGFGKAASGRSYPAIYMSGKANGVKGFFRSDDTGATWVRINDNAHQYGWTGKCVIGDPRVYGRVYVATNGRGIIIGEPSAR